MDAVDNVAAAARGASVVSAAPHVDDCAPAHLLNGDPQLLWLSAGPPPQEIVLRLAPGARDVRTLGWLVWHE